MKTPKRQHNQAIRRTKEDLRVRRTYVLFKPFLDDLKERTGRTKLIPEDKPDLLKYCEEKGIPFDNH